MRRKGCSGPALGVVAFFLIPFLGGVIEGLLTRVEIPAVNLEAIEAKLGASQRGSAVFLPGEHRVSEAEMQRWMAAEWSSEDEAERDTRALIGPDGRERAWELFDMTAPGEDRSHDWVNSYLVGILPFTTKNKWLPLYYLDQRKTYQWDHEQYGLEEVWQTSAQAFVRLRGDCEDHAIVLADWLISLGIDARVVAGYREGQGHAWVVAFRNDQTFLLEATAKDSYRAWRHYPLASLTRGYRPQFMFNRTTYWVNDGDPHTTDYEGPQWRISATYTPASGAAGEG